jgi:hypothetical protein
VIEIELLIEEVVPRRNLWLLRKSRSYKGRGVVYIGKVNKWRKIERINLNRKE